MMINQEIIRRNVEVFGEAAAIDNAVEELSELIHAIQKLKRGEADYVDLYINVTEEMADVLIAISNIKYAFKITDENLQTAIDMKQQRQVERIALRLSKK